MPFYTSYQGKIEIRDVYKDGHKRYSGWNLTYSHSPLGIFNICQIILVAGSTISLCYLSVDWIMLADEFAALPLGALTCMPSLKHWTRFSAFTARDVCLCALTTCLIYLSVVMVQRFRKHNSDTRYEKAYHMLALISQVIVMLAFVVCGVLACIIEDKLRGQFGQDYFLNKNYECPLLRRISLPTSKTHLSLMSAILSYAASFVALAEVLYRYHLYLPLGNNGK